MSETCEMGEPGTWAEFGLPGLVIFALFASIFFIVKTGLTSITKINDSHKDERKEWRSEATARQESTNVVIKELSEAIKDSYRRGH